jgi:hypothetical protein
MLGKATLRVSKAGMMKLELLGSAVATAAAETASAPDAAGWVRVVIPIGRIDHAAGELIRLGVDVEALEPEELRHRIAEMARDVSRLYRRRRPMKRRPARPPAANSASTSWARAWFNPPSRRREGIRLRTSMPVKPMTAVMNVVSSKTRCERPYTQIRGGDDGS